MCTFTVYARRVTGRGTTAYRIVGALGDAGTQPTSSVVFQLHGKQETQRAIRREANVRGTTSRHSQHQIHNVHVHSCADIHTANKRPRSYNNEGRINENLPRMLAPMIARNSNGCIVISPPNVKTVSFKLSVQPSNVLPLIASGWCTIFCSQCK